MAPFAALFLPLTLLACPECAAAPTPRAPTPHAPTTSAAPAATAGAVHAAFRLDVRATGIVLGDSVNVRSGPSTAYEIVARLPGGARVEVVGEAFGWLLVRPTSDVKVYVAKELLEEKGAGIAAVRKDRVNLRSRASLEGTVVGQASRGDLVRVLEAGPDFTGIAAPAEASFYVHRDLLRLVEGEAAVPASAPRAEEATVRAGLKVEQDPAAAAPAAAPAASHNRAAEKVLRARDLYLAELDKGDIARMDFAPAKALFEEALAEALSDEVRTGARVGLKRLLVAARIQADYREKAAALGRDCTPQPPSAPPVAEDDESPEPCR